MFLTVYFFIFVIDPPLSNPSLMFSSGDPTIRTSCAGPVYFLWQRRKVECHHRSFKWDFDSYFAFRLPPNPSLKSTATKTKKKKPRIVVLVLEFALKGGKGGVGNLGEIIDLWDYALLICSSGFFPDSLCCSDLYVAQIWFRFGLYCWLAWWRGREWSKVAENTKTNINVANIKPIHNLWPGKLQK